MGVRNSILLAVALLAGFPPAGRAENATPKGVVMKLHLSSGSFADGQPIPRRHAFDGQNLSPALQWSGVPPAAKSLALIVDDPDAPVGTWVHWVIYRLPPGSNGLPEGVPATAELENGVRQGVNDFKRPGYGGPMPPPGHPHRYLFKLYALDTNPDLKPGLTKKELLKAMKGHVLAEGQLMGTYQR